ncbi:protein of unknown function [Paraburkholderia dioscoreae]|uniref:Uncharacterized protein n=1 Tax=Paraburkholderia dioscoreae TaxID=2604047 RepID=A0A5Q4YW53_9BURK|nr:protein of unknown function [Paraburkholderia dioscoreae]
MSQECGVGALTGRRRLDYGSVMRVAIRMGGAMARRLAAFLQEGRDNRTVI